MRPTILAPALLLTLLLTACGSSREHGPRGCKRDTDCKGDRVCVSGECVTPSSGQNAPAQQQPQQAKPANGAKVATVVPPPQNRNGVVRAEPAYNAAKVTELPRGTTVTVLQSSPDGLWRRVRWNVGGAVGDGWIHRDVLAE